MEYEWPTKEKLNSKNLLLVQFPLSPWQLFLSCHTMLFSKNACSNHISFPVSITDSYSSTVRNCFVGNYPFTCYQIITYMYILPHHVHSWFVFYEAIFCFVTYISFCSQWNSFEIAAIWWPSLLHLACYICFVTFNSSNCFICLWGLK